MEPHDILIISLLPAPADLERARAGWYRVPCQHAPASLAEARALAFYQPTTFAEGRWQVAWWARVTAVEERLRRELIPDEPEHRRADEPYLCIRLSELEPIIPPKQALKGRRLLFVPTTWGAFEAAVTLDELVQQPIRPVSDDPLYAMIHQQIEGKGGLADPDDSHQRRLFEEPVLLYEELDW